MIVAAFDVDKTLVVRDCVLPFMSRVTGPRSLMSLVGVNSASLAKLLARRERDRVKELIVGAVFEGRTESEVRERGEIFAQSVASSWIRHDVAQRLRFHQEMGHHVVLVSASLDAYLEPLGRIIGVDNVLCTRLEVGDDGRLTGRLVGPNCRGRAKVMALEAAYGPITPDRPWLGYAYGDSEGDREMLAVASVGVNVKRTTLEYAC